MPLTDVAARAAKTGEKVTRLFDSGGLYLEVTPAGGKWWRFKYRFDDEEKRIGFGVFPAVGLKASRVARDEARRQLAASVDPGAARKAAKLDARTARQNSFESISRQWLAHRASA